MTRRRMLFAHIKKLVRRTITSANGLVSFKSNVEMPLKVTCEFSPIQEGEGDPSPENQRPISGWGGCEIPHTGKNLVPDFNVTYEFWSRGWLNSSGGISSSSNPYITSEFIQIKAGSNYIFSTNSSGWKCNAFFDENKRIISGTYKETNSGTAPQNAKYIRISFAPNRSGTTYLPTTVQLELGSTTTDYEPYQSEAVTINWKLPDEYQEVEYLEANKKQYFWADIPIQDGLTVDAVQSFNAGDTYLFGGYAANTSDNKSCFNGTYGGGVQGAYPSGYYILGNVTQDWAIYHVVTTHKDGIITLYVNDILNSRNSGGQVSKTGSRCCVFAARRQGPIGTDAIQNAYSGRVYNLKVLKDNTLLADYVPCYRKADNKPGMYDLVTGTFYVNQGTGDDFTVGPDVSTLPGIVYGGTVTLNEDGSADLTATWIYGTPDYNALGATSYSDGGYRNAYNYMGGGALKDFPLPADHTKIISDKAVRGSFSTTDTNSIVMRTYSNYIYFGVKSELLESDNLTGLKAYLVEHAPAICYPLKQQDYIVYHFSNIGQLQSFLGNNAVWHDMNGQITVEYYNYQ